MATVQSNLADRMEDSSIGQSAVVWVWKPNFGKFRCSQPFVCQVWLSSDWPEVFTFSYCAWLWKWLIKGPVHFIEEFFSSLEKQSGLQENTNSIVLEVLLHEWNYRLTDWLANREIDMYCTFSVSLFLSVCLSVCLCWSSGFFLSFLAFFLLGKSFHSVWGLMS